MPGLRKWAKSKLGHGRQPAPPLTPPPPSLPFLPPPDGRLALTPSPSSEDLASSLRNYGLFEKLPCEIRTQILAEAFGNRTLHIDLSWDKPLMRQNAAAATSESRRPHCGLGSLLVRDRRQDNQWQWFGCVCHRRTQWSKDEAKLTQAIEPSDDECIKGSVCDCEEWGGVWPDKCFIGVMGWLLACRQAYIEAMDVLFSTNTFHFSRLILLQNIQRLLPPRRLETITSLELLWDFCQAGPPMSSFLQPIWDQAREGESREDTGFHDLCRMVPATFPHVRRLYISLHSWINPVHEFDDPIGVMEKYILGPVENMLRQLGPDREFSIAVQQSAWQVLMQRHRKAHPDPADQRIEMDSAAHGRFWRSLGGDLGYWMCVGLDDVSLIPQFWVFNPWGPLEPGQDF